MEITKKNNAIKYENISVKTFEVQMKSIKELPELSMLSSIHFLVPW